MSIEEHKTQSSPHARTVTCNFKKSFRLKIAYFIFAIVSVLIGCRNEPSKSEIQSKIVEYRSVNEVYPSLVEVPELMEDQHLLYHTTRLFTFDSNIVLKKNGQYNGYNKEKSLVFTGYFKESKPDGIFYFMDKHGRKLYSLVYQNGVKEGPILFYSSEGFLKAFGMFKNDRMIGNWLEWYDYKTPRMQRFGVNENNVNSFEYNRKGNLIKKSAVKSETDSSTISDITYYYDNGKIKEECKEIFFIFRGGTFYIDSNKTYYSNGNLKCVGSYIKKIGKKELNMINTNNLHKGLISFRTGLWTYYDSLGNTSSIEYYDNKTCKLVRRVEYTSGNISGVTEYNGIVPYGCSRSPGHEVKEGKYTEYHDNQAIKVTGMYLQNKRTGKWKYYQQNGRLIKEESYVNDTLR